MKVFITVIFILITIIFNGKIYSQDKILVVGGIDSTAIENVSVITDKKGTMTDENGFFDIRDLSPILETDSITFTLIGYLSKKIILSDIRRDNSIVFLEQKPQLINEVTVTGGKVLQESLRFEELSPMKMGVFAFGAEVVGDSIYVVGGDATIKDEYKLRYEYEYNSSKMQIYDISSDKWIIPDVKLSKRAYHNIHYYNGKIYILGGKRLATNHQLEYLNEEVEIYDIKTNTVLSSKTNPHQAMSFTSGLYEDNIVVLSGSVKQYEERKVYTKTAHLFHLTSGYWYQLDDVPYRCESTGVVVDSILYQIGGLKEQTFQFLNSYNILTGVYYTNLKLPLKLERASMVYNKEEKIIYIYGIFETGILLTYNIQSHTLYAYKINLYLKHNELVCTDNYLYIIGGQINETDSHRTIPSNKLYRIDLTEFEKTKKLLVSKSGNG